MATGRSIGRAFMQTWRSARASHRAYRGFVRKHPIALIPLAVVYVGAAAFALLVCGFAVSGVVDLLRPGLDPEARLNITLPVTVVFVWGPLVLVAALHYLYITFDSFLSASQIMNFAGPVFQVLQLVATTMIFFAVIHYYIALLSKDVAYDGLARPMTEYGWSDRGVLDKLLFVPSWDTIIDCVYFSAVTMATVGYGDIKPVTMAAKIATIVEILFSFALIVVVLGWVIGHAKATSSPPAPGRPHAEAPASGEEQI